MRTDRPVDILRRRSPKRFYSQVPPHNDQQANAFFKKSSRQHRGRMVAHGYNTHSKSGRPHAKTFGQCAVRFTVRRRHRVAYRRRHPSGGCSGSGDLRVPEFFMLSQRISVILTPLRVYHISIAPHPFGAVSRVCVGPSPPVLSINFVGHSFLLLRSAVQLQAR